MAERRENPPPTGDRVKADLRRFADLIRRLDGDDRLLEATPLLLRRLGDLRRVLFDYEVRVTERLLPTDDPQERESRRVIEEALRRVDEMLEEWQRDWTPDQDG